MPEMLKPTSLIMGAGLGNDVACLTDGRFSGGYVYACTRCYRRRTDQDIHCSRFSGLTDS